MALKSVGKVGDFVEFKPVFVELPGRKTKIAVYRFRDQYFAYLDQCPHQGGPVCEGIVIGNEEAEIIDDGTIVRRYISQDRYNIACPWHGVEFNLQTGVCRSDSRERLMAYPVFVEDEEVLIRI